MPRGASASRSDDAAGPGSLPARPGKVPRLPRLVVAAEFERGLGSRSRAATDHFAVHHVAAPVTPPSRALPPAPALKLSTIDDTSSALPVDDIARSDLSQPVPRVGAVVPKRHARRAVTRSLLKRQIYAAAERHRDRLAPGLWIVRLRSPFDRSRFPSASSVALRRCARAELDALLDAAIATTGSVP